jgi:hypothetical protein
MVVNDRRNDEMAVDEVKGIMIRRINFGDHLVPFER